MNPKKSFRPIADYLILAWSLWIILCDYSMAAAETRFVSGVSDGLRTYAVIQRNGAEYRTDQLGVRFNQQIWEELSAQDKTLLIKAYGWQVNRRADHFGTVTNNAMAEWINSQQGWTQAAEALKQRHAAKKFPTLEPVFGKDAVFVIPEVYAMNPETVNTEAYKEAVRLRLELQADYAVGKQVYDLMVNAKWEEISIAVKTLSEPLIKTIVDNFITGFVTNGASKVSELTATMYGFINDLRGFVKDRMKPGAQPLTPVELIDRLEKLIADMEQTAQTAVTLIQQKKERLEVLAKQIRQSDDAKTQEKKTAASTIRTDLIATAAQKPAAASLPDLKPSDPTASPEAQQADITAQAQAFFYKLQTDKNQIESQKTEAVNTVVGKYSSYISSRPNIPEGPAQYLPDVFDGFTKPYFEMMHVLTDANQWVKTDLPKTVAEIQKSQTGLNGAVPDAHNVMDSLLPLIDALHAKALWLDNYKDYLGYIPSDALNFGPLRNFDSVITIIATPERTTESYLMELTEMKTTAELEADTLTTGVSKRESWIKSEQNRYDSLRFNFENSLSYVIAALNQLDQLHADPYFKKNEYPLTCYDSKCLYQYTVNVDAINAEIQSKTTWEEKEIARIQAVEKLLRLRAEEERLAQKLAIAQNSHINDGRDMDNFFHSVASRYRNVFSDDPIIEEFQQVTGKTMKKQYDLWHDLVPDITYYYLGDGNWIRNGSNVRTNILSAVEQISGKITEYYLLTDLYRKMETEKSRYLAMNETEFNAFMETTSKTIESYITAFQNAKVWGVDYPAWQLVMKTQNRQERLNSLYRYGTTLDPIAWSVKGRVATAEGMGIPGVFLVLNGNYLTEGNPHYVTASTTTARDGSFEFDFIGTGAFTLTAWRQGYQVELNSKREQNHLSFTVNGADVNVTITAAPTTESGYIVSGSVTDETGAAAAGVTVALTSGLGVERTTLTASNGTYVFMEVPTGTYTVFPSDSNAVFSPFQRTVSVTSSVGGENFVKKSSSIGNLNKDGRLDLSDAILALQISSGISPSVSVNKEGDCNVDGKIGLEEAIYAIQILSEDR